MNEDPRIVAPRTDTRTIGRILCVNTDGGPQFSVYYGIPKALRDPELFTEFGIFYQNHQTESGQWVYKYLRPLAGRPSDPDLTDYRHPTDANWDGPKAAKPQATWQMVEALFEAFINDGCTSQELSRLRALSHAAFHRLPVPDAPIEIPAAIPTAVISPKV